MTRATMEGQLQEGHRFYSTLFPVFAPGFMAGGWLVAFTEVGAGLIFLGSAMAVLGIVFRPRLKRGLLAVAELAAGWLLVPGVLSLL